MAPNSVSASANLFAAALSDPRPDPRYAYERRRYDLAVDRCSPPLRDHLLELVSSGALVGLHMEGELWVESSEADNYMAPCWHPLEPASAHKKTQ